MNEIFRKLFTGLERDKYLPSDAIVTCRECAVGNNAVAVRCFVFQFFIDSFGDT